MGSDGIINICPFLQLLIVILLFTARHPILDELLAASLLFFNQSMEDSLQVVVREECR